MLILSPDACCDICLEQYSQTQPEAKMPASLGCGHTFCKSCIYTLGNRVCPVCRQPFSVTDDMRRLHVDMESRSSVTTAKHEMKMLECCRSGDLTLMEEGVLEIEQWLLSQGPSFRCSLPTVVELARLLMEATSQLHEALERSQMDEKSLRIRQELDSMKADADRRKLQQETEALRVGMVRQREHLAYLESELAKARENTAAVAAVKVSVSPPIPPTPKRRPALPTPPPVIMTPLQNSNSPNLTPRSSWIVVESPTQSSKNSRPNTPTNRLQKAAPVGNSNSSTVTTTEPPTLRRSRNGLQGPRDRALAINTEPARPPGAGPSAFSPIHRESPSPSVTSHESSRITSHDTRRTSLPTSVRSQSYSTSYSSDTTSRRQRFSAQPTSWRPMEVSTSSKDGRLSEGDGEGSFLPYLHSSESRHETPPIRPTRSQPPSTIDMSSLSRKRAMRRQSKDVFI